MALKYDVSVGGYVQDTNIAKARLEFKIDGALENPTLEEVGAPSYNLSSFTMSDAILAVDDGQIGSFKVEIRSSDDDGTNETTHISDTINVASAGPFGLSLTISEATIAADKVVKLYIQYVSGAVSSDISLTME